MYSKRFLINVLVALLPLALNAKTSRDSVCMEATLNTYSINFDKVVPVVEQYINENSLLINSKTQNYEQVYYNVVMTEAQYNAIKQQLEGWKCAVLNSTETTKNLSREIENQSVSIERLKSDIKELETRIAKVKNDSIAEELESELYDKRESLRKKNRNLSEGYASIGYRIRNDEMFDSLFPTTDLIYDGLNFVSPFVSDLSQCKRSVVISCPKVKIGRQIQIAERLIDLATNGMEVVLYTKEENEDTLRLQHQGISVIIISHLSLHAAIIDKSTIWYGSVNILGYRSAEDNLIRFKNPEIAMSLFETFHKDS